LHDTAAALHGKERFPQRRSLLAQTSTGSDTDCLIDVDEELPRTLREIIEVSRAKSG
jgi:hypothetical protein